MRTMVAFAVLMVACLVAVVMVGNNAKIETQRVAVRSAVALRESQLAGCGRSREDRKDSILGWSAAREARLSTAHNPEVPIRERLKAAGAAAVYKEVIAGFKARIVNCGTAFPPVQIP